MNGASITNSQGMSSPSLGWQIVGIADFDGDGKATSSGNTSDGAVVAW